MRDPGRDLRHRAYDGGFDRVSVGSNRLTEVKAVAAITDGSRVQMAITPQPAASARYEMRPGSPNRARDTSRPPPPVCGAKSSTLPSGYGMSVNVELHGAHVAGGRRADRPRASRTGCGC